MQEIIYVSKFVTDFIMNSLISALTIAQNAYLVITTLLNIFSTKILYFLLENPHYFSLINIISSIVWIYPLWIYPLCSNHHLTKKSIKYIYRCCDMLHRYVMIMLRSLFILLVYTNGSIYQISIFLGALLLIEFGNITNVILANKTITYKRYIYFWCCCSLYLQYLFFPNRLVPLFFVANYYCDIIRDVSFLFGFNLSICSIYAIIKPFLFVYQFIKYNINVYHWLNIIPLIIYFISIVDAIDRVNNLFYLRRN